VEWHPRTKDPKIERARTKVGRQSRLDRLPTRRAIEGLGEIFRLHAKRPKDRLLICAVGLLLVAGFRLGELLRLPSDGWVAEVHRGRERCGLRFWNRKTQGGTWQWAVRWLSPMGAELARDLLAEIGALTQSARDQSRVLERDPSRVVIPNTEGHGELLAHEVALLFGTNKIGLNQLLHDQRLRLPRRRSPTGKGRENLIPKAAVEAELLARRGALHTFDLGNGRQQLLSDTLLIVHPGFLDDRTEAVMPLLVTVVKQRDIGVFLKSRKKGAYRLSAFERFGIQEPEGEEEGVSNPSVMRSHVARHWLNTVANKAGMSAFQISMWMQRADASQTLLYLHSASDIADLTREGMRDGALAGRRVEDFNALPPEQREDYLATIRSAHKTATGICTADFGVDQCEVNKACELGCLFYLRTPGDPVERANLLAKRARFVFALEQIAAAERDGKQILPRLREINVRWLAAIDRTLALDDSQECGKGRHKEATDAT